jgi:large subunit ribosomal protein L33
VYGGLFLCKFTHGDLPFYGLYAIVVRQHFITTMSQKSLILLKNKETGEVYWTRKNKKLVERKVEYKKYSAKLRKHVTFKEAKK